MTSVYIALGSNLRNPEHQLRLAALSLDRLPSSHIERLSSIYRSAPVGPGEQADYLNAVICLATTLSPTELLTSLQRIEQEQGRERGERWGPRTLDLDLLLYGDLSIATEKLTIPHPRMHERDFVLYPLHEISDTRLALPDGRDLGALMQQCPRGRLVKTQHQFVEIERSKRGQ